MTLGKRLSTVIVQFLRETKVFVSVELSLEDGHEMAGYSSTTLGRNCTVIFIHIMVMKCMSLCATWPSTCTIWGSIIMALEKGHETKENMFHVMVMKDGFFFII